MKRTLRIGDKGDDVRALQDVLNFHIRRLAPLEVDGKFGNDTHGRVIAFQKSNALQVDGVVGRNTNLKLFESEVVSVSVGIIPKLALDLPNSLGRPSSIRPPTLIPPLSLPGQPTAPRPLPGIQPPLLVTQLRLAPSSRVTIPALNTTGQILNLTLNAPSRNDPDDPALKSFRQIVQLLDTLPPNFPFRAMIINAVPNPVKKIGDLEFGFQWGIEPLFDLKQLTGPTEFLVGATGDASYTLKVINRAGPGGLKLGIFAKGDFKAELDYTTQQAISRPLLQVEGSFVLGAVGRF